MQFLSTILILSVSLLSLYFLGSYLMIIIARRKALSQLDIILFPEGDQQKGQVVSALKKLTKGRFDEDQTMDYFRKIKGAQIINLSQRSNFWIKKYLFRPTKVKLNYFEQVNFYKMFLNYPQSINALTTSKNKKTAFEPWQKKQFQNPPPVLSRSMA